LYTPISLGKEYLDKIIDMKKNDIIQIEITDIGMNGEGIGKVDGLTMFIKDAIVGDIIEARIMKMKKNYGYACIVKIIKESSYRVEPKCPIAKPCGGCQLQALSYEEQLKYKQNKVYNHFQRIGKFNEIPMEPIVGMENPYSYRNKAQFPIGRDKEGNIVAGFYASRTHSIIATEKCYIGAKINEEILRKVISFMEEYKIEPYNEVTGAGLVRHVLIRYGFTTKEIMVCLVINRNRLKNSDKLIGKLVEMKGMTSISINMNKENTNVILGTELKVLWGQGYITDYIGDIKYQISPLSFYQVNPMQTRVLYEKALNAAGLTGNEIVWDLYCGIGTISLFLAKKAKKVYGVEIVPQAIIDAKENARINGITNAEFFVGKAEEVLPQKYKKENVYADVIVVDPPRKGCEESLLDTMIQMKPKRIVYVSCDSATLARDLEYLCRVDYEIKTVCPVDMFPHSTHVETVVLLSKLKSKKSIGLDNDIHDES
jgi:23S rRNA (uracil-5-)-methyltransferase RumA